MERRDFLRAAGFAAAGLATGALRAAAPAVPSVLGPVPPEQLGAVLMHEHAPTVDWSELYETPAAPVGPAGSEIETTLLKQTEAALRSWHESLPESLRPGTIVEATPIRVGRHPELLVKLAQRVPVRIVACTGFWCEAMAPQHPWAVRLGLEKDGVRRIADLYIREIRDGIEDPNGPWGARFTRVRAGIIKCATSTYLRPSERRCHEAAAIASRETGCPITTHTTNGGGLEQAQLFLKNGVKPEKVIIGHMGNMDDRKQAEPREYHRRIAELGCYVQFDRVGHAAYPVDKMARLIKSLVDAGHTNRLLVGHDHVPFVYRGYADPEKPVTGWQQNKADFSIATTQLTAALDNAGVPANVVRAILVENPRRVLAF
jgi:phosphotriesterase-related protein